MRILLTFLIGFSVSFSALFVSHNASNERSSSTSRTINFAGGGFDCEYGEAQLSATDNECSKIDQARVKVDQTVDSECSHVRWTSDTVVFNDPDQENADGGSEKLVTELKDKQGGQAAAGSIVEFQKPDDKIKQRGDHQSSPVDQKSV